MPEILWMLLLGCITVAVVRGAYRVLYGDRSPIWRLALGVVSLRWLSGPALAGNYLAMLIAVLPAIGVAARHGKPSS